MIPLFREQAGAHHPFGWQAMLSVDIISWFLCKQWTALHADFESSEGDKCQ